MLASFYCWPCPFVGWPSKPLRRRRNRSRPRLTNSKRRRFRPNRTPKLSAYCRFRVTEEFCKNALDLKLENATVEDAIARIKAAFPSQQVEIRQRDTRPLQVSLDLKETTVGTVLTGVATLCDCKLWVFPDGLLIAPPGQLNPREKKLIELRQAGDWAQSAEVGGHGWSNSQNGQRALANIIAQEVKANDLKADATGQIKATFGAFSPQAQGALQQLVNWSTNDSRVVSPQMTDFILTADSPVLVNVTEPDWISIDVSGGASDPANSMGANIRLTPIP